MGNLDTVFPNRNPNPIMRVTQDGEIIYHNLSSMPLLKEWGSYKTKKITDPHLDNILKAIKTNKNITDTVKCNNDTFFSFSYVPVIGKESSYVNMYGINVTELHQYSVNLTASEKKYKNVVENINEGIWVIDANAETVFINKKMSELLGYTFDEMKGKPLFDFMNNSDIKKTKFYVEQRQKGVAEIHDFTFRRKDGSYIETRLATSPLFNNKGEYDGAIAGVIDISEIHNIREELKFYNRILEYLFSAIMDFLITNDFSVQKILAKLGELFHTSRIYIFENKLSEEGKLFGKVTYEWIQKGVKSHLNDSFFSEPNMQKYFSTWTQMMNDGKIVQGYQKDYPEEIKNYKQFDDIKSFLILPIFSKDNWWGGIGIEDCQQCRHWNSIEILSARSVATVISSVLFRLDIEKALYENEILVLQKNRALKHFLHSASHDLKSPLITIQGFSELVSERTSACPFETCSKEIGDWTGEISKGIDKLYNTIESLLDQPYNDKVLIPRIKINPTDIIDKVIKMNKKMIDETKAKIKIGEMVDTIFVHEEIFYSIVQNLIVNAIAHAHIEGKKLEITIEIKADSQGVVLKVTDNGPGIDESIRNTIFYPLTKLPQSKGNGMGLSIVKQGADFHEGRAWEEDNPNGGAVFCVYLQNALVKEKNNEHK